MEYFGKMPYDNWQTFIDGVEDITIVMMIINFCSIDGLKISWKYKVILTLLLSISGSMYALFVTYKTPTDDTSVIHITSGVAISVYNEWADAVRVLAIFLWKQSLALISNPEKCINIRSRPYAKWV